MIRKLTFAVIIVVELIALHYSLFPLPPLSPVVFVRYDARYSDGCRDAVFRISNHTAQWADILLDQVEVKTTFGWKDYTSELEKHFYYEGGKKYKHSFDLGGSKAASPNQIYPFVHLVPRSGRPWRLHVRYNLRGQGTFDVYSKTMPSDP